MRITVRLVVVVFFSSGFFLGQMIFGWSNFSRNFFSFPRINFPSTQHSLFECHINYWVDSSSEIFRTNSLTRALILITLCLRSFFFLPHLFPVEWWSFAVCVKLSLSQKFVFIMSPCSVLTRIFFLSSRDCNNNNCLLLIWIVREWKIIVSIKVIFFSSCISSKDGNRWKKKWTILLDLILFFAWSCTIYTAIRSLRFVGRVSYCLGFVVRTAKKK